MELTPNPAFRSRNLQQLLDEEIDKICCLVEDRAKNRPIPNGNTKAISSLKESAKTDLMTKFFKVLKYSGVNTEDILCVIKKVYNTKIQYCEVIKIDESKIRCVKFDMLNFVYELFVNDENRQQCNELIKQFIFDEIHKIKCLYEINKLTEFYVPYQYMEILTKYKSRMPPNMISQLRNIGGILFLGKSCTLLLHQFHMLGYKAVIDKWEDLISDFYFKKHRKHLHLFCHTDYFYTAIFADIMHPESVPDFLELNTNESENIAILIFKIHGLIGFDQISLITTVKEFVEFNFTGPFILFDDFFDSEYRRLLQIKESLIRPSDETIPEDLDNELLEEKNTIMSRIIQVLLTDGTENR